MTRWALVLVLAASCGADGTSSAGHVSPAGLCALCNSDSECETGICRLYGDGYKKCSTTCTPGPPAPQCSGPAMEGCNNMGYCTCPRYEPPADADTSGTFKDAPMAPSDAAHD